MGGDRRNPVVSALFEALPAAGVLAARFDFSSADVDIAAAEVLDALELLDADRPRYLVGYSFGGGVAATIDDERIAGWVLVAPALSMVAPSIGADGRPKLVLAAAHDQWFGPTVLGEATAGWSASTCEVIEGADHFFAGRTAAVAAAACGWVRRTAEAAAGPPARPPGHQPPRRP